MLRRYKCLVFSIAGLALVQWQAPTAEAQSTPRMVTEQHDTLWAFRGSALYLQRNDSDAGVLFDSSDGSVVLNADQFEFDFEVGYELAASRQLGSEWAATFRFFEVNGFEDQRSDTVTGGSVFGTDIRVPGTGNFVAADTLNTQLRSDLVSFDAMLDRRVSENILINAGFRYLSLDDTLNADFGSGNSARSETDNDLYGFQMGFDASLIRKSNYDLGFRGLAGIYLNDVQGLVDTQGASDLLVPAVTDDDLAAFVGEISLDSTYRLTRSWSLVSSTRLLWLSGVATATDQLVAGNLSTQIVGADRVGTLALDTGDVFYYGGSAGLLFEY